MASNFNEMLDRTLTWMLDKGIPGERVSEKKAAERIAICEACPGDWFDPERRKCNACGCYVDVKTKLVYDPIQTARDSLVGDFSLKKAKCIRDFWT